MKPEAGRRRHRVALPGVANLHSHAFQRGMAGMAETARAERRQLRTWRDMMYRFATDRPRRSSRRSRRSPFVEMLEAGFVRSASFTMSITTRRRAPFADPAEMGATGAARRRKPGSA